MAFIRGWLIAQGREVYEAALHDPDTLSQTGVQDYVRFELVNYAAPYAYEKLTGLSSADYYRAVDSALLPDAEILNGIHYAPDMDVEYDNADYSAIYPQLYAMYCRDIHHEATTALSQDIPWFMRLTIRNNETGRTAFAMYPCGKFEILESMDRCGVGNSGGYSHLAIAANGVKADSLQLALRGVIEHATRPPSVQELNYLGSLIQELSKDQRQSLERDIAGI